MTRKKSSKSRFWLLEVLGPTLRRKWLLRCAMDEYRVCTLAEFSDKALAERTLARLRKEEEEEVKWMRM